MRARELKIKKLKPILGTEAYNSFISKIRIGSRIKCFRNRDIPSFYIVESFTNSKITFTSGNYFINRDTLWMKHGKLYWGEELRKRLVCLEIID